jgi:VanZ family protein
MPPETGTARTHGLQLLVVLNVVYAVLLVVSAVSPRAPGATAIPDEVTHAFAYGLQAVLLIRLLSETQPFPRALVIGCLGALGLGVFTECLQLLQPTRSAESTDILADAIGVLSAGALVVVFRLVRVGIDRRA